MYEPITGEFIIRIKIKKKTFTSEWQFARGWRFVKMLSRCLTFIIEHVLWFRSCENASHLTGNNWYHKYKSHSVSYVIRIRRPYWHVGSRKLICDRSGDKQTHHKILNNSMTEHILAIRSLVIFWYVIGVTRCTFSADYN